MSLTNIIPEKIDYDGTDQGVLHGTEVNCVVNSINDPILLYGDQDPDSNTAQLSAALAASQLDTIYVSTTNTSSSPNNIEISNTISSKLKKYIPGMRFLFKLDATVTANTTMSINGLAATTVTYDGSPIVAGTLVEGALYSAIYNNDNFDLRLVTIKDPHLLMRDRGELGVAVLDNITELGVYNQSVASDATEGKKYPAVVKGILRVSPIGTTGDLLQTYSAVDGNIYTRELVDGVWSEWFTPNEDTLSGLADTIADVDDKAFYKDGSKPATGDFNMDGRYITGLEDGVNDLDAVNLRQLNAKIDAVDVYTADDADGAFHPKGGNITIDMQVPTVPTDGNSAISTAYALKAMSGSTEADSGDADPDTAEVEYLLTNNTNTPDVDGSTWWIDTKFKESVYGDTTRATADAYQVAYPHDDDTKGVWYRTRVNETWSSWKRINDKDTEAWNTPTLINGYTNVGGTQQDARYKIVDNVVFVEGMVKPGIDGKAVFELPAGYRPSKELTFASITGSTSAIRACSIVVKENGELRALLVDTDYVSITISFRID